MAAEKVTLAPLRMGEERRRAEPTNSHQSSGNGGQSNFRRRNEDGLSAKKERDQLSSGLQNLHKMPGTMWSLGIISLSAIRMHLNLLHGLGVFSDDLFALSSIQS